jgi:hypothetical protein
LCTYVCILSPGKHPINDYVNEADICILIEILFQEPKKGTRNSKNEIKKQDV